MNANTDSLKVTKLVIELGEPATVKTTAPVAKTSAPVTKTTAPVTPPAQKDASLFWKILAVLALLALIAFAIGSFIRTQAVIPPTSDSASTGSTANSAASNPVSSNETWAAVLTSANSNGNFIGDMGGKGNGAVIPATAVDLDGKTWNVGRALLTYCETSKSCFYMFATPGDVLPRAFNVNLYTPQFTGDLEKELQYVDTGWNNNSDVSWTYWNSN